MDNRLLKSKMALFGDTIEMLAEYLELARPTLSNKMNGKADFTQSEMLKIKSRYKLTDKEFMEIFNKEVKV